MIRTHTSSAPPPGLALIAVLAIGLFGLACGGQEGARTEPPASPAPEQPAEPQPTEPQPTEPPAAPTTPEECTAAGGHFVPSTGGQPSCPAGEQSIGAIRFGVEGGLCCK